MVKKGKKKRNPKGELVERYVVVLPCSAWNALPVPPFNLIKVPGEYHTKKIKKGPVFGSPCAPLEPVPSKPV